MGEVVADIRISDRGRQGIGQTRQCRIERALGLIAGQRALQVEIDGRRELIIHAREQRIALVLVLDTTLVPAPQHVGACGIEEVVVGFWVLEVHDR